MKSFSEILKNEFYNLENILLNCKKYYAHWKDNPIRYELLSEHLDLTLEYFLKLIEANNLEIIINSQINKFVEDQKLVDKNINDFIKEIFVDTIYFHDFGKINENFQIEKMQKEEFSSKSNGIGSKHSILSAHLFLYYYFCRIYKSEFGQETQVFLWHLILIFVHPITQHHGKLKSPKKLELNALSKSHLEHYTSKFNFKETTDIDLYLIFLKNNFHNLVNISIDIHNNILEYSLIKLNSSLLTASDYYSTNHFMLGIEVNEFGIMDSSLKNKISSNIKKIEYNKKLYANLHYYNNIKIKDFEERNNENLNILRQKLSSELIVNIKKAENDKLFYIEAPTGSGKTNLSLLSLVELFTMNREITKVFYVFPFTTLITQTYNSIKDNLRLSCSEIVELHSKANFNLKNNDGFYGSEILNYIDSLFVNYPITLMSHVSFFDILTSISKEKNYILHRLANSVVIIDELQSYSPSEWDKINYLIQNFSMYYNITFIIMSATLPKISKLLIDKTQNDNFNYLIENRNSYYKNTNFSKRVKIEEILKENYSEDELVNIVLHKSELYASNNKNSIKCLVEFISKKRASKFYDLLLEKEQFCKYKIFLISGTILEPRRKEIIDYLKTEIKTKIIVVTTQVIEAGVDIDMDIGFKDKSLIDSEEQISGRINRNAGKDNSVLYIFYSGDKEKIYGSDIRNKLKIKPDDYLKIIRQKEFDLFYDLVFEQLNKANENEYRADTLAEFLGLIEQNNYKEIDKAFQLIKNNSLTIFVPIIIKNKYLTKIEMNFLETFIEKQEDICGFDVWNIYENIIHNRIEDFIISKINIKMIVSIMSKFTFSVWKNSNEINKLLRYGEEKYGYLFLENYQSIYSFNDGLKSDLERDINFIGF